MTRPAVEPGLLRVFRWFVGIRLVLLGLTAYGLQQNPGAGLPRNPGLGILFNLILFAMLMIPAVENRMGRFFLPVTLAIASVGPIFEHTATVALRLDEGLSANDVLGDYWQLFFLLFVPLILIAWQYRYRAVLLFAVGTTFLDAASLAPLLNAENVRVEILGALAVGRGVLFAFVGAFVVKLVGAQKEARQVLTHHAAALEDLATSRERNRLARELHDTLAHGLSGVAVQLEAVDALWDDEPQRARTMLRSALEGARSGLGEARRAIGALRAGPLEDVGLAEALTNLSATVEGRSQLEIEVEVAEAVGQLKSDLEQVVYRITDEALTNAARHSGGSRARVKLARNGATVTLTVADDGNGFAAESQPPDGHMGLIGMRERAEIAGGQLVVTSEPGTGTKVEFSVEASG